MAKIYDYYKDLPSIAKGIVVVGALGIAYIVGRRVYKELFPSEQEKANKQLTKDIANEIEVLNKQGVKPTFPDSTYFTMANTIYESMRYAVGDDYGTVESTMKKMKNDLDVAKLIKAFGKKQDYFFGIPEGQPKDLISFVQSELGNDYGGLTNYRIRNIQKDWNSKGITYKL
jgi:hypothetical protein